MFEWLFGKTDTAESLSKEVFGFFSKFRAIQVRIQKIVDATEIEMSEEETLNQKNMSSETELHEKKLTTELNENLSEITKSMALAQKIVNFADEA